MTSPEKRVLTLVNASPPLATGSLASRLVKAGPAFTRALPRNVPNPHHVETQRGEHQIMSKIEKE